MPSRAPLKMKCQGELRYPYDVDDVTYVSEEVDYRYDHPMGKYEPSWALSEYTWPVGTQLWLTLSEHGLFDCQAEVVWSDDKAMRLEFIAPSEDFTKAYQRVLSSFMH